MNVPVDPDDIRTACMSAPSTETAETSPATPSYDMSPPLDLPVGWHLHDRRTHAPDARGCAAAPDGGARGDRRGRRARGRVPPGGARAPELLRVDARLPDEPQRLRGDGRPAARGGLRRGAV